MSKKIDNVDLNILSPYGKLNLILNKCEEAGIIDSVQFDYLDKLLNITNIVNMDIRSYIKENIGKLPE